MTEEQATYKTQTDEVTDAMQMLGKGYEQEAPATIESPRIVRRLSEEGLQEIKVWGWVKTSVNFISHIKKLKGAKLAIWMTISLSIDENGECKLTILQLESLTGYGHTEIVESIKELKEMGYLGVEKTKKGSIYEPSFTARGKNSPSDEPFQKVEFQKVDSAPVEQVHSTPSEENPQSSYRELKELNIQDIQNQADQSMDALLEFEKMAKDAESKGHAWNGREFIPPPFLPYADWFHAKTGLEMFGKKAKPKQDTSWLKEFKDWHDNEIDLESLNTAYEVENGWRREKSKIDQNITHPRELTAKAKAIAATPKAQERKPDGPVIHRATGERQGITMQEAIARGLIPQKGS